MSTYDIWAPDLILSGAPWISDTGAVKLRLAFGRYELGTDKLTSSSTVTVDRQDDTGTSILASPATATLDDANTTRALFLASVTPTSARNVKRVYRAKWTWTVTNDDGSPRSESGVSVVDLYPTPYPWPDSPISLSSLAGSCPVFLTEPASTWRVPLLRAWYEISAWLIRQRSGALWSISEIAGPLEHLTRHYMWQAVAGYGSATALANAAAARTAYELALKDVQLAWDSDGDNDVDKIAGASGSATDSGPVV